MIKRVPARVTREPASHLVEVPLCTVAVRFHDLDRARIMARSLVLEFLEREHKDGRLLFLPQDLPPGGDWEWLELKD